jgi:ribosomal protein L40E
MVGAASLPSAGGVLVQHSCRACGYGFLRSAYGECCSARCVAYLAAGYPDKAAQARRDHPFADRTRFGPVGQFTRCRGCGLTFESRGLRLCPDCYAVLGDPVERKVSSIADRPVRKQVCRQCGGALPAYRASGRRKLATALYCSPVCKRRAKRQRRLTPSFAAAATPGA